MESFIKAIENRKFDPLPKLIYADYLDEQGNEESEFWRWIGNTRIEPEEMIHCNTFFWNIKQRMQSKETLKGSIIEKEIFQHLKSNERSLLPEYSKRYKTYIDAILALRNAWLKQQEKAFVKAKNTDIGLEDLIRHPEK